MTGTKKSYKPVKINKSNVKKNMKVGNNIKIIYFFIFCLFLIL